MNPPTKSELLFRTYCANQSYQIEKVPEDSDETPDFLVSTPLGQLIAEIKELRANKTDKQVAAQSGHTMVRIPGKRVQKQIDRSKNQTERYLDRQIPCVIVLYDNIVANEVRPFYPNYYLSPTDLAFGMYGELKTTIFFDKAARKIIETRSEFGKNQNLTAERRKEISAVCVLSDFLENNQPCLYTYHNVFATPPRQLSRKIFSGTNDRHFKNPVNGNTFMADWIPF
jgi:hypothetical protein